MRNLIDFELWALRRVFDALEKTPSPRYKPQLIFAHILNAYTVWYDRMTGRKARVSPWDEQSIDACRDMIDRLDAEYRGLLEGLDDAGQSCPVEYTNTRGVKLENTVGDILQHLVLHSSYHRGQVNALIRAAGGEPAAVDYILYIREPHN